MIHFSSDAEIERIGLGVFERTLPKPEWTHAAHFAAAFWVLCRPGMNAEADMPKLIRAYNLGTGVPNTDAGGYHETITLASLRAAREWLSKRGETPLHEALNGLLASKYGRSDWLLEYWSKPVLFSVMARRAWIDPDLKPLPF
ncbi:MAG TPA: hypothetical protein VGD45_29115 [Steroidobacter sp.]|uniref:hypothetical protein n=1 Tax=Steroidobacter sp. TaxID=1978227 RepID=UPI002EDA54DB